MEQPALAVSLEAVGRAGGAVLLGPLSLDAFRGEGLNRLSPELLKRNSQQWLFLSGTHPGELDLASKARAVLPTLSVPRVGRPVDSFGTGIRGIP